MLGVVLELFVVEKDLFARSENKLGAAVNTLKDSIGEFHGRLPSQGVQTEIGRGSYGLAASGSLISFVVRYKGPDRTQN